MKRGMRGTMRCVMSYSAQGIEIAQNIASLQFSANKKTMIITYHGFFIFGLIFFYDLIFFAASAVEISAKVSRVKRFLSEIFS